jgi:transposase
MAETGTLDVGTPPAGAPAETNGSTFTTTPAADWRESLPPELKLDKTLADFKDVGSLAKSYVETKKHVGDAVRVPKADAKPEEIAAFYKRLGRPESAAEYKVAELLPKMPEGQPGWDSGTVESFEQTVHQLGFTPAQVAGLVKWYGTDQLKKRDATAAQSSTATKAAIAKAQAALEQEWGPKDSPLYKRNVGLARTIVRQYGSDDPELAQEIESQGNNPALVKLLAKVGAAHLEDEMIDGDFSPAPDKAALDGQIREARAVLQKLNPGSRDYASAKANMDRLYQMRYAGGK